MPSRACKPRISYAEVSSDEDWSGSEANEGASGGASGSGSKDKGKARKSAGDSYGTAKPVKKKTRRSSAARDGGRALSSEKQQPKYDADLILRLPFDLLAEVATHLDGGDLIRLAQVSKGFHTLFLSPSTRSLWVGVRRRDGYELPNGISELDFALLLHGKNCQDCGSHSYTVETLFLHRTRLCSACLPNHFVDRGIPSKVRHLHRSAFACVQNEGNFVLADLEAVNDKLQELEDADEAIRSATKRKTLWSTKSRRRMDEGEELQVADGVERFVAKMQAEVAKKGEDMQRVIDRRRQLGELECERLRHEAQRLLQEEADEEAANLASLVANGIWTTQQVDYFKVGWQRYRVKKRVPTASAAEDPEGWKAYGDAIQAILDEAEAEKQAQPGRQARLDVLRSLYDDVKDDLEDELDSISPSFYDFQRLSTIKPLWHPRDAVFDSGVAAKDIPVGRRAFREFAEEMRVLAIRHILAAKTNTRISTLSKESSAYPAEKYDDDFFGKVTSTFISRSYQGGYVTTTARPYPYCVQGETDIEGRLRRGINFKQYKAIETVLVAANLDEDTTAISDLNTLGEAFKYPACKRKTSRNVAMNWFDMVILLMRQGPGVKKLEAGETVKLTFTPPDDHDAKGKGKGKARGKGKRRQLIDDSDDDDGVYRSYRGEETDEGGSEEEKEEEGEGEEGEDDDDDDEVEMKGESDDDADVEVKSEGEDGDGDEDEDA